ncbi:hypothetical protein KV697_19255 [Sphingomonas sanguinis]|uniref:Uncharacterized protein n=1 Tax=Sphingomonas sanguinis TaxID=33051 RepID=A0ABU5LVJ3_9SPHN|nr:hypothetical protein [Sphingomonas sanguinis]MDZ7283942.1 hypothetical protein [Sphingomonas sanguinis]QXT37986.1 hypothetical protein KV697_19255 [Sphingomonas sanguinis]
MMLADANKMTPIRFSITPLHIDSAIISGDGQGGVSNRIAAMPGTQGDAVSALALGAICASFSD